MYISEEILWYELCENTPIDSEQSAKHFGELANSLQILHCYQKEWSEDNIITLLDELTSKGYKICKTISVNNQSS
jgi:hypothetical protein